ncbi:PAS and ANTAR domain-containing protein [Mycobacterium botniense]|uniref:histidine kinase n=1 Tax=Mycobacterium botniense TaxID=84962 RepID=A0A7I9Y349_9MYCO|nr:putative transcription antitermination regulator [Mycobacterium botniense]
MAGDSDASPGHVSAAQPVKLAAGQRPDPDDELRDIDLVIGLGEPQRVGRFRFFLDGQRWEWSDAVARMHGYQPGSVVPTTELLLHHKHPDDHQQVTAALEGVLRGEPFSSRHRIVDAAGHTRWVVVVGDRMLDDSGAVIGTSGFYVDVTESLQSDVSAAVSQVADSRARIEQAKGVLMAAYGISAERAFDILVWRSQETNIKVRELAGRFLNAIGGNMSGDTTSRIDHALLTLEKPATDSSRHS